MNYQHISFEAPDYTLSLTNEQMQSWQSIIYVSLHPLIEEEEPFQKLYPTGVKWSQSHSSGDDNDDLSDISAK